MIRAEWFLHPPEMLDTQQEQQPRTSQDILIDILI